MSKCGMIKTYAVDVAVGKVKLARWAAVDHCILSNI